ncbi:DUF3021 family protein [Limosilactobacillus equigenerosi]|uniref:DUF3021 family protein n=1 Tax=Limosilactobacillus equigenerosi TaxID=417373 RepID=UPI0006D06BA7|nr:DUF3021 family protein [Limosilactobacillus equigenerosi]
MKWISKVLEYIVTGIGFGASSYLLILTFLYPGVAPTVTGVGSVFVISGLIGILSMILKSDLPLMISMGIHLLGTFSLFLIMVVINSWPVNWQSICLFLLIYVVIWVIIVLEQKRVVSEINKKIKASK